MFLRQPHKSETLMPGTSQPLGIRLTLDTYDECWQGTRSFDLSYNSAAVLTTF
jgi:hypothetical protein